jgi:hypothetical protein
MTIDRTKIMTAAWAAFRSVAPASLARLGRRGRAMRFANCLRNVWAAAKFAARSAVAVVVERTAALIRREILSIECKDRLSLEDWNALRALSAELATAERGTAFALAA